MTETFSLCRLGAPEGQSLWAHCRVCALISGAADVDWIISAVTDQFELKDQPQYTITAIDTEKCASSVC
jgi:hypothetical protein